MTASAPGRAFVHVGVAKTGTTYLQTVLEGNRRRLAADGVGLPGPRMTAHFYAAQDLRGIAFGGHTHPAVPGAWDRLAADIARWSGRSVVVSHEMLAGSTEEQIARAAASVHGRELHVVLTARDLGRQIPAMWQETVKNGRAIPFRRYLKRLARPRERAEGRGFWRGQDIAAVLRRWSSVAPPERIHVVTVPARSASAPPDELWRRFSRACDLDRVRCDTEVARRNVSLGLAEAELLRRLNQRLADRFDWPRREQLVKRHLAEGVLARRQSTPRVEVPPQLRSWVAEQSADIVARLARAGYDVVGSLDDLLPVWPADTAAPDEPHPDDLVDAALDALTALLDDAADRPAQHLHVSATRMRDSAAHVARELLRHPVRLLRSASRASQSSRKRRNP
ncbi:MAG: hypothetical protein M3P83_13340 [Actinomycetota bacterium]|nr:hypothetical protein [Actinomycetota bacterium]